MIIRVNDETLNPVKFDLEEFGQDFPEELYYYNWREGDREWNN